MKPKPLIATLVLNLLTTLGWADVSPVQQHVDAAMVAAGPRWANRVFGLCDVFGGVRATRPPRPPRDGGPITMPEVRNWPEEPARIFDNVYFVGSKGVSSFAIDTSEGIIITDGMWAYDVGRSVVGGLSKQGLDPRRIRYVIVPHGHPDHYGGAQCLKNTFGARIVMAKGDIALMQQFKQIDTTPAPDALDLLVEDGDSLTLGGTTLHFSAMPGHSPGGVVMDFPVTDQGRPHRMLIWAAGSDAPGTADNLALQTGALQRLRARALVVGIDAMADNHGSHLLVHEMRSLPARPGPFLVGHDDLLGYLDMRMACNAARIATATLTAHRQHPQPIVLEKPQ